MSAQIYPKLKTVLATSPTMAYRLGRKLAGFSNQANLYYVTPNANWSIDWDGRYITSEVERQFAWATHLTSSPYALVDHIVHYGELWSFLGSLKYPHNKFNVVVATLFHGNRTDEFPDLKQAMNRFVDASNVPDKIVTACSLMMQRLTSWGVAPEKIVQIPLGVELTHFQPASETERLNQRRQRGIPDEAVCIGSFQKDGNGWGEGLQPKLIKGPDIFLSIIDRLSTQYQLHVLLTGPSRGYVKKGLEKLNIPYTHHLLSDYRDIVQYYQCLDLYLVTSREEGGPKATLEAPACGIPLISTRVGMAADVVQHQQNGLLAEVGDVEELAELCSHVIEQAELRSQLIRHGLETVKSYDWPIIAARYFHELYQPLRTPA